MAAPLPARDLARVAARFKLLAEPARLAVLQHLQTGPRHVGALVEATGLRQANLSKHLHTLHAHGLVARVRQGRFVLYAIADPVVMALCELVCRHLDTTRPAAARRRPTASRRVTAAHPPAVASRRRA